MSKQHVRHFTFISWLTALLLSALVPASATAQLSDSALHPSPFGVLAAHDQSAPVYALRTQACTGDTCAAGSPELEAAVKTFFENSHASALQIAVHQHGHFIYSKAFGSQDPGGIVPATSRSLFQIGSNTKKATALAILRAVQSGAIGLDDTIDKVLPELTLARDPEWTHHATVRHLLSHQSGLWDYTPWLDAPADADLREVLYGTFAEHEWSTTPPGAVWNYSNANFSVLGAILEQVYGQPYRRVVEREVYRPLQLRHTYARREEALESGRAVWSYGLSPEQLSGPGSGYDPWSLYPSGLSDTTATSAWVAPEQQEDGAFVRAAGLTWSTAEDECRIGGFLVSGEPAMLNEDLRRELLSAQVHTSPDPNSLAYSFGLMLGEHIGLGPEEAYDIKFWEHGGATLRMSSEFFAFPEQELVFSVLTNTSLTNQAEASAWQMLAIGLIHTFVALPPAHAPVPPQPADDGARYAGTYADPLGLGTVELTWNGSQLTLSAPGLTAAGAKVDENVLIAQKNVLVVTVDGQQNPLEVWPSPVNDATYLVSRTDSLTRITAP